MGLEPDAGLPRPVALSPDDADAVGYIERSLATSPVWQMGTRTPQRRVARPDPNLLDFLASARKAPLGELEFDLLTWAITRWYQTGRPADGRLAATFGDIIYALYGRRKGGKQYMDVRESLDGLYNVSIDLSVITVDEQGAVWRASSRRRIIQELNMDEDLSDAAKRNADTVELRLSSWLVEQLDANTVAAIGWQTLRSLGGIAKRLAIFLAAHAHEFEPITQHTERFAVKLTDEFYEQLGVTAARERQRRQSVARAAARIAEQDPRYTRLLVERIAGSYELRAERPRGARILLLPTPRARTARTATRE
jgi:hypothetical protein